MDEKTRWSRVSEFLRSLQAAPSAHKLESAISGTVTDLKVLLESAQIENTTEGLQALELIRSGGDTPAVQLIESAEAIVSRVFRPVIDISGDGFSNVPAPWEDLNSKVDSLKPLIRAVGRLDGTGLSVPYLGTGFLISPTLLLTNRHVARQLTEKTGQINFSPATDTWVDLKREYGNSDTSRLTVREVKLIHPYWDMALIEVEGAHDRQPLKLAAAEPARNRRVVVVGFPYFVGKPDLMLEMQLFRGVYGYKRLQPGLLVGRFPFTPPSGLVVNALGHDASTLGGSSGSAVIDIDTLEVVALHFAGEYMIRNYAVPSWELLRDPNLIDAGMPLPGGTSLAPDPEVEAAWAPYKTATSAAVPSDLANPSPGAEAPASEQATGDWFERIEDETLATLAQRRRQATERRLSEAIPGPLAKQILENLAPTQEVKLTAAGLPVDEFITAPDPSLPEIILIHGILGGHLDDQRRGLLGRRAWMSPIAFAASALDPLALRLSLADDGVTDKAATSRLEPSGLLQAVYGPAALLWKIGGFAVHEFAFDWRKDMTLAADRLHHFIEQLRIAHPGRRFAIVAHSMGGLVACAYASRHREWMDAIQHAIFLGTPLGGSFAPVEVLLGQYPFMKRLDDVDLGSDIDALRAMAATFPGLLQMLPSLSLFPGLERLYNARSWTGVRVLQRWLSDALAFRSMIDQSPLLSRTSLLVSLHHGTVNALQPGTQDILAGERDFVGDGTVPAKSLLWEGLKAWRVDFEHAMMPLDPKVHRSVDTLLRTGTLPTSDAVPLVSSSFDVNQRASALETIVAPPPPLAPASLAAATAPAGSPDALAAATPGASAPAAPARASERLQRMLKAEDVYWLLGSSANPATP